MSDRIIKTPTGYRHVGFLHRKDTPELKPFAAPLRFNPELVCKPRLTEPEAQVKSPKPVIEKSVICSRCNDRPKAHTKGGKMLTYCRECARESAAEQRRRIAQGATVTARRGLQIKLTCPSCKERPKHKQCGYCLDCYRKVSSKWRNPEKDNERRRLSRLKARENEKAAQKV